MPGVDTVLEQLGRNLKRQRKKAGLTQEVLAQRAEVDRTLISLIERGKKLARIDTLVKLSRGLAVPLSVLLQGVE